MVFNEVILSGGFTSDNLIFRIQNLSQLTLKSIEWIQYTKIKCSPSLRQESKLF